MEFTDNFKAGVKAKPKTAIGLAIAGIFAASFVFYSPDSELYGSSGSLESSVSSDLYDSSGGSFSRDAGYSSSYDSSTATVEAAPAEDDSATSIDARSDSMVVTGSLTLEVQDPGGQAEAFALWLERNGGYVEDAKTTVYDVDEKTKTEARMTVRIEDLSFALSYLKDLRGEVLDESVTRTNVSLTIADLDARIRALEISISRLEDYLNRASTYKDLFQVERELSSRQGQLDSLESQRKILADQVEYQTLEVFFVGEESRAAVREEASEGFTDGLRDGWNSLVDFVTDALYLIGGALTWLILLGPLALLLLLVLTVVRRMSRRAK